MTEGGRFTSRMTLTGLRAILDYEFEEPEGMSRMSYEHLSAEERDDYDTARLVWFGAGFLVDTPETHQLLRSVKAYLRTRDIHSVGSQRVVVLDGPPNVGKTTMLIRLAREIEEQTWRRDPNFRRHGIAPTVMIEMTPGATPKDIAASVIDFYGIPYKKRESKGELIKQATRAILAFQTSVLIVDELQMLKLDRRTGDDAIHAVKALVNSTGVVTVLAGNRLREKLVSPAAAQLMARGEVQELLPFSHSSDRDRARWAELVVIFARQMHLIDGDPDLSRVADALHALTAGHIGNLKRVLSAAMSTLIDEQSAERGAEQLTDEDIYRAAGCPKTGRS